MRHISTPNEARDIDQIRKALGERKLSYWGVSYGTYAGAVYATMFPDRTDRVVLDSNDDPDPQLLVRKWANNFAVGAEDRFPDFAAWAAERDSTYGLGATPAAVRSTYLNLAATFDQSPRPGLTGNYLRAAMFTSLYNTASFPLLAETLHAAQTGGSLPTLPVPPADQFQNTLAVSAGTVCNDSAWPRSVDFYAKAVAQNRQDYPLTAGMPANIFPCAFWAYKPLQPVRITSHGPDNVLLVQNLRDPATPYSGALKMLEAFGHRARMVTVNSGGHGSYLVNGNACGDSAVTEFLVSGVRRAATC
jgi:pimeloyl-ACP methyl ester carboxylesterase